MSLDPIFRTDATRLAASNLSRTFDPMGELRKHCDDVRERQEQFHRKTRIDLSAISALQKHLDHDLQKPLASFRAIQKAARQQIKHDADRSRAALNAIRQQIERDAALVRAAQDALRQQLRVPRSFGIDLDALRPLRVASPATSPTRAPEPRWARQPATAEAHEGAAREKTCAAWAVERIRAGWIRSRPSGRTPLRGRPSAH